MNDTHTDTEESYIHNTAVGESWTDEEDMSQESNIFVMTRTAIAVVLVCGFCRGAMNNKELGLLGVDVVY